jgi:hypothetical protein
VVIIHLCAFTILHPAESVFMYMSSVPRFFETYHTEALLYANNFIFLHPSTLFYHFIYVHKQGIQCSPPSPHPHMHAHPSQQTSMRHYKELPLHMAFSFLTC